MTSKPVCLGGSQIHDQIYNFVRPLLPDTQGIFTDYEGILKSGMVTTGPYAERLGETVAQWMGVKKAVAVSSCTTGLLLATQALQLPKGSEVILPSFTFMATALGPVWNGLIPRFVDVDLETMNIDVAQVKEAINANTSAILAVHQFGVPANITALQDLADQHHLVLYFDAAHGMGSLYQGKPLGGSGKVEVFSLSPTKVMIAGEGGIVSTNDESIGEAVYYGRNYANPGNYDCLFPGLNARMSEFHAILALKSFANLEHAATIRNQRVADYQTRLMELPGISFQKVAEGDRSSYKDFTMVIYDAEFGLSQQQLLNALKAENIQTRVYYNPVLHQMTAFKQYATKQTQEDFKNSIYLSRHALSLPLYSDMQEHEVDHICEAIQRIHVHAEEIRRTLT